MEIPIWEAQNKNCSNFTSAYLTVLLLFNIFFRKFPKAQAHIYFLYGVSANFSRLQKTFPEPEFFRRFNAEYLKAYRIWLICQNSQYMTLFSNMMNMVISTFSTKKSRKGGGSVSPYMATILEISIRCII